MSRDCSMRTLTMKTILYFSLVGWFCHCYHNIIIVLMTRIVYKQYYFNVQIRPFQIADLLLNVRNTFVTLDVCVYLIYYYWRRFTVGHTVYVHFIFHEILIFWRFFWFSFSVQQPNKIIYLHVANTYLTYNKHEIKEPEEFIPSISFDSFDR